MKREAVWEYGDNERAKNPFVQPLMKMSPEVFRALLDELRREYLWSTQEPDGSVVLYGVRVVPTQET